MKKVSAKNENISLLDRLAVAFLSGMTAIITSGIFWFSFLDGLISIKILLVFVLIMTILGFFLLENVLVNLFGWLWRLLSVF
jgi:hypothetical protein